MKRYNDYFTLLFVTFLTLFSFFHMSTIVDVSHDVITIVFKNLLPSLLPFMILVSLCLNLGILDILAYFLQIPFYNLFSLVLSGSVSKVSSNAYAYFSHKTECIFSLTPNPQNNNTPISTKIKIIFVFD